MEENKIKVYIKIDKNNCITQIESEISSQYFDFKDTSIWTQIDEGNGNMFAHAQNQYLEKPLRDIQGKCNYKYVDSKVIALTVEEKEKLYPPESQEPTTEETLLKEMASLKIEIMKLRGGHM